MTLSSSELIAISPNRRACASAFYDGGWFDHLWHYLDAHSPWKAAPAFPGIHDMLRWHLHRTLDWPLAQVALAEAHYVRDRATEGAQPGKDTIVRGLRVGTSLQWESILELQGIIRHDIPLSGSGEKGADVELALSTYERAIVAPLDVVTLVTGDADFVPLVRRLQHIGVEVIIPRIEAESTAPGGERGAVRTSTKLTDAADHSPTWEELLTTALDPDYRLRYPFTKAAAVGKPTGNGRASDGYRYGTVNRWRQGEAFGFITDTNGLDWFVHEKAVRDEENPTEGQPVRFNGKPAPMPGQRYPQARAVEAYDPAAKAP